MIRRQIYQKHNFRNLRLNLRNRIKRMIRNMKLKVKLKLKQSWIHIMQMIRSMGKKCKKNMALV